MISAADVKASVLASFAAAERIAEPYAHFIVRDVLPAAMLPAIAELPFEAPALEGVSGTREVHNKSRSYFDAPSRRDHPAIEAFAEAFQDPEVIEAVERTFGADLSDTLLRIEYAQDTDGFWLEPHTDIGVKNFTMLLYLSDEPQHSALGTSIYADRDTHVGETPFAPNLAMIFVPSDRTWHGFERRPIEGVRRSVIINYVTQEWRAREQLAFPETPVKVA